ncbi:alpha/beta hydrolase [Vibrio cholerae]|nr:alpha/beta hydrolase [Vibrio cholerae]EKF9855233.1 alpha/beta hydrolase [Vibrio cholerae]
MSSFNESLYFVIVPGYTNSGPRHWQSILERKYENIIRVKQKDWNKPDKDEWINGIEETVSQIKGRVFLIGHSCGSIAITQWAEKNNTNKVIGSILVAPADVESEHALDAIKVQRPIPYNKIPFACTVIYSDNDEHLSVERAENFVRSWGCEGILIKGGGHFHTAAGYGEWSYIEKLIESLSGHNFEEK